MASEKFEQLIRVFCASVQIEDVATVLDTGSVSVNDVAFSIFPADEEDAEEEAVMVYCDFGPVPGTNAVAVLRRLLEVNLFLSSAPLACSFSINPESQHVILGFRSPLDETNPETLTTSLRMCAQEAEHWRESYFLEGQPQVLPTTQPGRGSMFV